MSLSVEPVYIRSKLVAFCYSAGRGCPVWFAGFSQSNNHSSQSSQLHLSQQQSESQDDASLKKKRDRFKGMSEDEVLMRMLPDHLVPNLDIVIVSRFDIFLYLYSSSRTVLSVSEIRPALSIPGTIFACFQSPKY